MSSITENPIIFVPGVSGNKDAVVSRIINDAQKFDFYPAKITNWAEMFNIVESGQILLPKHGHTVYAIVDDKGWALVLEAPDYVEMDFVFVYPDHRRTGWFTRAVHMLRSTGKEIVVCAHKPEMLRALEKLGFAFQRFSGDGKDLMFTLHP